MRARIRDRARYRIPAASPTIEGVRAVSVSPNTDELAVEVDVHNSATGNDWFAYWIEITSPKLSEPLIHSYCEVVETGATKTVHSQSESDTGNEGLFLESDEPIDVTVRVGGKPDGLHCDNAPAQGAADSRTVTFGGNGNGDNGNGDNGNGDNGNGDNGNGGNGGDGLDMTFVGGVALVLLVVYYVAVVR